MAIEKNWLGNDRDYSAEYIPTCDNCGDELPGEYGFDAARDAMRAANWESAKADGGWFNFCPNCYTRKNSAASDFEGVVKT